MRRELVGDVPALIILEHEELFTVDTNRGLLTMMIMDSIIINKKKHIDDHGVDYHQPIWLNTILMLVVINCTFQAIWIIYDYNYHDHL